jgi:hypothetical protein
MSMECRKHYSLYVADYFVNVDYIHKVLYLQTPKCTRVPVGSMLAARGSQPLGPFTQLYPLEIWMARFQPQD